MPDTLLLADRPAPQQVASCDAIVIGAGISGMCLLHRLRRLIAPQIEFVGNQVQIFERVGLGREMLLPVPSPGRFASA